MSHAALSILAIKLSVVSVVLGIGLTASPSDVIHLVRRPLLLGKSILAMNVLMPCIAVALASALSLPQPVKIVLVTLAMAPVPPMLPSRSLKAGATKAYTVSLFATESVLAVLFIPITVWLVSRYFGVSYDTPEMDVVRLVLIGLIAPLVIGLLVHRLSPGAATRLGELLLRIAPIVLVIVVLPLLVGLWSTVRSLIHDGAVLALAGFILAGVLIGHLLGGPDPDNRTTLALATASRHPGLALTVASANFQQKDALIAAVALALGVNLVVTTIYVVLKRSRGKRGVRGGATA